MQPGPTAPEAATGLGGDAESAVEAPDGRALVTDGAGRPLVVYHGTHNRFSELAPRTEREWIGPGMNDLSDPVGRVFFSTNRATARSYGKYVIRAHLAITNPLIVDAAGGSYKDCIPAAFIRDAVRGGHDGVIVRNIRDGAAGYGPDTMGDTVIVFSATQIHRLPPQAPSNRPAADSRMAELQAAARPAPAFNVVHGDDDDDVGARQENAVFPEVEDNQAESIASPSM